VHAGGEQKSLAMADQVAELTEARKKLYAAEEELGTAKVALVAVKDVFCSRKGVVNHSKTLYLLCGMLYECLVVHFIVCQQFFYFGA